MAVPHRVVVLALDQVPVLELGIPSRVFGFAEDEGGGGLYEVVVCSADGEPVSTAEGLSVAVARGPEALELADTVIVPPAEDLGELEHGGALPASLAAALARIRPGTRMVSICTGSYVLAAAGLLDGRIATTHWMHSAAFRRAYPRVQVDEDVLFVDNGDVLTAAGVAAGLDLCLHLVRRDHGAALANRVARRLIVPVARRRSGTVHRTSGAEPRRRVHRGHPGLVAGPAGGPVTLDDMAAHARMSVRTFTRRFRAEVGVTPGRWLTAQRLDRARELLEHTDLSIDLVAERSGFGTGNSLRQHMRALLNTSPHAYRRTFRRAA